MRCAGAVPFDALRSDGFGVARRLHDDRDVLTRINPSSVAAPTQIEMRPGETGRRLGLINADEVEVMTRADRRASIVQ
jgi:hypothetical protein